MTHVHVEVARNTKTVVERMLNSIISKLLILNESPLHLWRTFLMIELY